MGAHFGRQNKRHAKSSRSSVAYLNGVLIETIDGTDSEINVVSCDVDW